MSGSKRVLVMSCALVGAFLVPPSVSYAVNGTHPCGVLESGYFLVSTQEQLAEVGSGGVEDNEPCRLDANYRLMNDLTLEGNWTPLPGVPEFSGEFDGNGKTIRNLQVNEGRAYTILGDDYLFGGLFSRVSGADIYDLNFVGAVIDVESTVENYVGVLSGVANPPQSGRNTISGIRVVDSMVSSKNSNLWNYAGGLVGYVGRADLDDITVERTKVSSDSDLFSVAGGAFGNIANSTLMNATAVCSEVEAISSAANNYSAGAGGIVGDASTSQIVNSYVFGDGAVRASSPGVTFAGGVIGGIFGGGVFYSGAYNLTVEVEVERGSDATDYETMAGGLVGWLGEADVAYSLAKNTDVSSRHIGPSSDEKPQVGGLVGKSEVGFIDNNYVEAGSVSAILDSGTASRLGGLLGYQEGKTTSPIKNAVVEYSYVNQTVTPNGQEAIGSVGAQSAVDEVLFRDDVTGATTYPGTPTFPLGLTGEVMQSFSTYDDNGWFITEQTPNQNDFWWGISPAINDGFPYLYWEVEPGFVIRDCSTDCGDECDSVPQNAHVGGQSGSNANAPGTGSLLAATGPVSASPFFRIAPLFMAVLGFWLIMSFRRHAPQKTSSQ